MTSKRTTTGEPKPAPTPEPRVAVHGDLNPSHCRYDPGKGEMVLGLDVFDGAGWETVLVKFGLLLGDEVGWLDRVLADARANIAARDTPGGGG